MSVNAASVTWVVAKTSGCSFLGIIYFDENGNLLESTINEAKIFGEFYEIATPNPKSILIDELNKSLFLLVCLQQCNQPENLYNYY